MNATSGGIRIVAEKVHMWAVEDLVPYARNAKRHPPEQIKQLVAGMREFGFTIPMLVAEDGMIIAGHGRKVSRRSPHAVGLVENWAALLAVERADHGTIIGKREPIGRTPIRGTARP